MTMPADRDPLPVEPGGNAEPQSAPLALVVQRRDYPTKDVLGALVATGYNVLERPWKGSVEIAAELEPALIVAVVSPMKASDLEVVRELAQSCESFVVLLADRHEGFAAGLLAGASACLCDSDGPEAFGAQFAVPLRTATHRPKEAGASAVAVAGPLVMDVAAHRAWYFGRELRLTPTEFAILLYLVQHQGTMCRSSRIVAAFKGVDSRDPNAGTWLRSHVLRIRRRLREVNPGQELVSNVRGIGYRLDVPEMAGPSPESLAREG